MDSWVRSPWNGGVSPPFESWLVDNVDEEEKRRIKACGNIVIPPQAGVGAAVLSETMHLN